MSSSIKIITGLDPPIGRYNYAVENSCKLEPQHPPRKGNCDEKQAHMGEIDINFYHSNDRFDAKTTPNKNASLAN